MPPRPSSRSQKLIDRLLGSATDGPLRSLFATTYEFQPDFFETDFVPSLLELGAWDDRNWSSRIVAEKRLAELEAAEVLLDADRYDRPPRSQRIAFRPVRVARGVKLHAKTAILVHQDSVRLLVGSANLTAQGYRRNRELAAVIRASAERPQVAHLVRQAILDARLTLAPLLDESAHLVLDQALSTIDSWRLPPAELTSDWFAWSGPERPLGKAFLQHWPGGEPIRRITIVSPFWSEESSAGPVTDLVRLLKEHAPVDAGLEMRLLTEARQVAPDKFIPVLTESLASFDARTIGIRATAQPIDPRVPAAEMETDGISAIRTLHAKCLLLEGDKHALAYVGSANFTRQGWGLGARIGHQPNVEAGLILLRAGPARSELTELIPAVCGEPLLLDGTAGPKVALMPEDAPSPPWPDFLRDATLTPSTGADSTLQLVLAIDPALLPTWWRLETVTIAGGPSPLTLWFSQERPSASSIAVDLTRDALEHLMSARELRVCWADHPEGRTFPVNVSLEARRDLPIMPGSPVPGENLLLAYYQGRLSWEELFPEPEASSGTGTLEPPADLMRVDTSRIQAYQIREFVEALDGLRNDLKAAAKVPATMHIALLGPVSPVRLATAVMDAYTRGTRSPMGAAFQLVEILSCLRLAGPYAVPEHLDVWTLQLGKAMTKVSQFLAQLKEREPKTLAPSTAFGRYEAEISRLAVAPETP